MIEGISHTSFQIVAPEDTAIAQGSGQLEVLATPRLVALMENAAMLTVAPSLSPEETTVGGMISITHLAPSPVGAEVAATAVLDKIEGRKLSFIVTAKEADKLIGEGTHVRFIVDKERFMAKLKKL
ncbi:MAG: thioesterase family protein [Bacteroidales bacterium]|nr:thioesterase family protein [Bacteroidales bacterium]